MTSKEPLEWAAPPRVRRGNPGPGGLRWAERIEQLRARPGEWAKFGGYKNLPTTYRTASTLRLKDPDIETACRREADGTAAIYARYQPS